MSAPRKGKSGGRPGRGASRPRKDRLIQTRVPRDLETTLKEEAERRRLTVSQLIRNVLEDSFLLVDGVVADVDRIVSDSVHLARSVRRRVGGRRPPLPADAERREGEASPDAAEGDLSHVYAWNEVVLHRPVTCSACGTRLERGSRAYAGLSDEPDEPGAGRAWLCAACIETL